MNHRTSSFSPTFRNSATCQGAELRKVDDFKRLSVKMLTNSPRVDGFMWIKDGWPDGDCWKSQHFDNEYDWILQLAHNSWG